MLPDILLPAFYELTSSGLTVPKEKRNGFTSTTASENQQKSMDRVTDYWTNGPISLGFGGPISQPAVKKEKKQKKTKKISAAGPISQPTAPKNGKAAQWIRGF